jgi:hypothetical protein
MCAVREPPAVITTKHSARLIALGYVADLQGRFRMTSLGRRRIAAGFEQAGALQTEAGGDPESVNPGPLQ